MTRWPHERFGEALPAPLRRDGPGDVPRHGHPRLAGRSGDERRRRGLGRVHVPGDGDDDGRADGRLDDLPRARPAGQRGDGGLDVRADVRRHRRAHERDPHRHRRPDARRAHRDAARHGRRDAAAPGGVRPPPRPAGGGMSVAGKLAGFAVVLALVFAGAALAGSQLDVHPGKTATEKPGMGAMDAPQPVRGLAVSEKGLTLELARRRAPQGSPFALAFRILDGRGQTVRDFDVEHAKRMHFIVVRRDMTGFQHLHPTENADGTWSLPVTLPEAGAYRVFADFSVGKKPYTLADAIAVDGSLRSQQLPAPAGAVDVDGLHVALGEA